MKILSTKNNLKNIIIQAERFTGKNINLPILSNIFIEAKNKKCNISATNLEIAIESSFPCKVVKEGVITAPSRILNTVLQTITEENITLEEKNNILTLQSENSKIVINGNPAKDFPIIPKLKFPKKIRFSYLSLVEGLKNVISAVSRLDLKPEISGVFLKLDGKKIKLVGTDTFRLAEKTLSVKESDEPKLSFIIPLKTAEEIIRLSANEDEEVLMKYSENQAVIELENYTITSRLVEGVFPEYGGIIPKNFESQLTVNKNELIQKIKSASVLSSKLNDVVLKFSDGELVVESTNSELGSSMFKIKLPHFKGKSGSLSFNYRYLLDGLESISEEEVFMGVSGDNSPALIRSLKDDSFIYVLMPIRNL